MNLTKNSHGIGTAHRLRLWLSVRSQLETEQKPLRSAFQRLFSGSISFRNISSEAWASEAHVSENSAPEELVKSDVVPGLTLTKCLEYQSGLADQVLKNMH